MMKRSSDNQHHVEMNGSMITDVNNDAKKARFENTVPSRVLHIRGVPNDAQETEVVQLGVPFGRISNILLIRQKNQALLEMADISMAQAMYNYYAERPPQMRGRTVYVQYSNHQVLKTDSTAGLGGGAQAAVDATDNLMGTGGGSSATNLVLRIIIDNLLYPITVDILHKIFSKYGQVLRIVTFEKNGQFQALLQYSDAVAAQTARQTLNGQNIYNGCCTLRVDASKLTQLNVKYNNDKSRDYTNPNLPSGIMEGPGGPQQLMMEGGPADGILGSYGSMDPYSSMNPGMAPPGMGPNGMGGGAGKGYGMPNMGGGMLNIGSGMPSGGIMGMSGGYSGMGPGIGLGAMSAGMGMQNMGRMNVGPRGGPDGAGTVVIVSNLNDERISPDAVFTLFGSYGTVIRVKILFNKKDTALVQYQDSMMAQNAINQLDRCPWWGKTIKVSLSKHAYVQMPKEDTPDSWLTKDFTNSNQHRFRNPSNKNHASVSYPPTDTLHLSNIASSASENDLRELFSEHGTVVAFKFFQNDRKMALIQMGSTEEAVGALVGLHNYQLQPQHHLRVSFTKSVIN